MFPKTYLMRSPTPCTIWLRTSRRPSRRTLHHSGRSLRHGPLRSQERLLLRRHLGSPRNPLLHLRPRVLLSLEPRPNLLCGHRAWICLLTRPRAINVRSHSTGPSQRRTRRSSMRSQRPQRDRSSRPLSNRSLQRPRRLVFPHALPPSQQVVHRERLKPRKRWKSCCPWAPPLPVEHGRPHPNPPQHTPIVLGARRAHTPERAVARRRPLGESLRCRPCTRTPRYGGGGSDRCLRTSSSG